MAPREWWKGPCASWGEKNVVHLDEERKAAMVSNLLVVLCGESPIPASLEQRSADLQVGTLIPST